MASKIEVKLTAMGLSLPQPMVVPSGVILPFPFAKPYENKVYLSGHLPLNTDGTIAGPFGKVGSKVSLEEAAQSAKNIALAMLSSLKAAGCDLDTITWLKVLGMVNCSPDFELQPKVINGFSEFIYQLYGEERGFPARSAIGVNALPFQAPVEIEAIVAVA